MKNKSPLINKLIERQKAIRDGRRQNNDHNSTPVVSFDEFIPGNFMGANPKNFVRCPGFYLMDMFKELRSDPNTNFITCMDEMINDPTTTEDEFSRATVSCILKEFTGKNAENCVKNELICSRLANVFGIKTEYVTPVKDNPKKIIAVDFLSGKEEMMDYREFTGKMVSFYKETKNDPAIKAGLSSLTEAVRFCFPDLKQMHSVRFQVQVDYIRSYLFKKYIVGDRDFATRNLVYVYTGNLKNFHQGPSFDYEATFHDISSVYGLERDMEYLCTNYPVHMEIVMADFSPVGKTPKVRSIVNKFACGEDAKDRINFVENMLLNINEYYKTYSQENMM